MQCRFGDILTDIFMVLGFNTEYVVTVDAMVTAAVAMAVSRDRNVEVIDIINVVFVLHWKESKEHRTLMIRSKNKVLIYSLLFIFKMK